MSVLMGALKKAAQGKNKKTHHGDTFPVAHEINANGFTDGNAALCLVDEITHYSDDTKQAREVSELLLDSEALEKELESIVAGSHGWRRSAELDGQLDEKIVDSLGETHLSLALNLIDSPSIQEQSSTMPEKMMSEEMRLASEGGVPSFRMDDDVNHSQLDINMMSVFDENSTEEASSQAEESVLSALPVSVENTLSLYNDSEQHVDVVKPIETLKDDKPAPVISNSEDTLNRTTADAVLPADKPPAARQKSKYRWYGLFASVVMLVVALGGGYVYYELNASAFTPAIALPKNIDLNHRAPLLAVETTVDIAAENLLAASSEDERMANDNPLVFLPKVIQSNKVTASPKPSIVPKARVQQPTTEISSEKKPSKRATLRPSKNIIAKKSSLATDADNKHIKPHVTDSTISSISIKSETPASIHILLLAGYHAYQRSDMVTARTRYQAVLQRKNKNRDAMLGLAAIALREKNYTMAQDYYTRLLRANPSDNVARGGLVSLLGELAPEQAESELKILLNQAPDAAYLYFSLGNIYVSQSRWADAQQAFFKSYLADRDNADYVYNLAVSLDFLGEHKTALNYYREAVILAERKIMSFDLSAVENRIHRLLRIVGG